VIAAILIAVAAGVIVVKVTGGGKADDPRAAIPAPVTPTTTGPSFASPTTTASTPSADASGQATAIDTLLDASGATRGRLAAALAQVDGCTGLATAVGQLQEIANTRGDQADQARNLTIDQLPDGDALRSRLAQALNFSFQADQDFLAWGRATQTGGCTGHAAHDLNYQRAQTASASATASKRQFLQLWNRMAAGYGLPARLETEI
jgi:hypothetical protein